MHLWQTCLDNSYLSPISPTTIETFHSLWLMAHIITISARIYLELEIIPDETAHLPASSHRIRTLLPAPLQPKITIIHMIMSPSNKQKILWKMPFSEN